MNVLDKIEKRLSRQKELAAIRRAVNATKRRDEARCSVDFGGFGPQAPVDCDEVLSLLDEIASLREAMQQRILALSTDEMEESAPALTPETMQIAHDLQAVGYVAWPRCPKCQDCGELDTKHYTPCAHCKGKHKEAFLEACALVHITRGEREVARRMEDGQESIQAPFNRARSMRLTKRQQAVDLLGGTCVTCGEKRFAALQIDHIHDDGAQHRQTKTGRGQAFLEDVLRLGFTEYQLLCGTCHALKTAEAREQRVQDVK